MQNFKITIPSTQAQNDLTIIYKDNEGKLHELFTRRNKLLKYLLFFQPKRNEIDQTKLIYIQENISFDIFSNFMNSIVTKEIDINNNNYEQYHYLSCKYQYNELKSQIEQFMSNRPDINSIIDQLSVKNDEKNTKNVFFDPIKEEIIAKNLDLSLQNNHLKNLPLHFLNRIFNSPHRILRDHHLLFSFITSLIKEKGSQKLSDEERENLLILPSSLDYCLMDNDEIEYLFEIEKSSEFMNPQKSNEKIKILIENEKMKTDEFNQLKTQICNIEKCYKDKLCEIEDKLKKTEEKLTSIVESQNKKLTDERSEIDKNIECLIKKETKNEERIKNIEDFLNALKEEQQKIQEEKLKKEKENVKEFKHQNGNEFNGIMRYLTEKTGGNIHDNKTIEISSAEIYNNNMNYHPKVLVDFNDEKYFDSNQKDAKICFDFKDKLVQLTSYSIKSHKNKAGNYIGGHLKNWIIEVSNDGENWRTIDRHTNDPTLNGSKIVATFNIEPKVDDFYRFIRLHQTGYSWFGPTSYDIFFYCMEFYGKLKEPSSK